MNKSISLFVPLILCICCTHRQDNSYYFHLLDLDGDGFVSHAEAGADPKLFLKEYNALDKDGDGKLSQAEFSHFKPDTPQAHRPGS